MPVSETFGGPIVEKAASNNAAKRRITGQCGNFRPRQFTRSRISNLSRDSFCASQNQGSKGRASSIEGRRLVGLQGDPLIAMLLTQDFDRLVEQLGLCVGQFAIADGPGNKFKG